MTVHRSVAICLLSFGLLCGPVIAGDAAPQRIKDLAAAGWSISKALSIQEVERQGLEEVRSGAPRVPQVPFGFANGEWIEFKAKLMPGDVLVRLAAPTANWGNSAGWEGYVIVRSGVVVATFVTVVS
jgi:hypothetical protein